MGKKVVGPVEFAVGWAKGVKADKSVKEIADSMGMQYGACLARYNNMVKKGYPLPAPKKSPRGRQHGPDIQAAIQAALTELDKAEGFLPE